MDPIDLNDVYRRQQAGQQLPQGVVIREAIEDALKRRPRIGIGSIAVGVFVGLLMWSFVMWLLTQITITRPPI
jgi:hypothetical protein